MAKDPAILWYWNDWQGGTMTLTRNQKGCYMDLLAAQFNSGPLSLEQVKTVLGTDQANWTVLQAKFKKKVENGNELFFNERMESEKNRRRAFVEKQSENGKLGGRPKKPKQKPTLKPNETNKENEIEDETETEIVIETSKGGPGENRKTEFLANTKWKQEFCMAKGLQILQLEKLMFEFISDCDLKGEYVDSYKRYFTNWFNKKQNGQTHQRTIPGGTKLGTSEARVEALKNWPARKSG